jgi:photosystem II stability/assembly factor-like uncharacterized protein
MVACASSSNHVAALGFSTGLYYSADAGVTWTRTVTDNDDGWFAIKVSAYGDYMIAASGYDGSVFVSTDYGEVFDSVLSVYGNNQKNHWVAVTVSPDGSIMYAATTVHKYGLYKSVNYGAGFSQVNCPHNVSDVVASDDGQNVVISHTGMLLCWHF